jgi:competence protein CoiA
VHTSHGLTVEFQDSHLRPDERTAREKCYGNMLWVVDGSRFKRDMPHFLGQSSSFREILTKGLYVIPFPDEALPRSWLNCTVPVFFDFENVIGLPQQAMYVTRPLWCLLPGRVFGRAVVLKVSREAFVRWIHDRAHPIPTRALLKSVERSLLLEHQKQGQENLRAAAMAARQRYRWRHVIGAGHKYFASP